MAKKQNKPEKASEFYSDIGMAKIAQLARAACEMDSQNNLARKANISSTTFTMLWRNEKEVVSVPQPDTLLRLATVIPDPDTGMMFDPWKFLAIATSPEGDPYFPASESAEKMAKHWISMCRFSDLESIRDYISSLINQGHQVMSNTTYFISDYMKRYGLSLAEMEVKTGISQSRLTEILKTNNALKEEEWRQLESLSVEEAPVTAELLKRLDPSRIGDENRSRRKQY